MMERYREYKESGVKWLGEIPSHWELRKIFGLFSENKRKNTAFLYKHAMQFNYGTIVDKNECFDTEETKEIYSNYSLINKGDIVINGLNLNYDFVSQRVAISPKNGIITSAYVVISPKVEINTYFYCYLFKNMDNMKIFHGMGTGVRKTLSYKELRNHEVLLPPLSEQDAIVRYLDSATSEIDKAIAMQQKMIDLLNERKQIIIQNAVTKGLDENVEMKESGVEWIGRIPKHWEVEPFGRHFTFGKGLPITKANLQEEGIAVISYGQIHAKNNLGTTLTESLVRYVSPTYIETHPQCLLKGNDFIFADTSEDIEGSGNFAFNDFDNKIFAGYHTVVARPNDLLFPKYYAYLFKSKAWKSQIQSLVNGVKVYSIGRRILKTSMLLIPSEDEQKNIVKFLDKQTSAIEKTIETISRQITLLQERKQIFINEVVTGKVRVS